MVFQRVYFLIKYKELSLFILNFYHIIIIIWEFFIWFS